MSHRAAPGCRHCPPGASGPGRGTPPEHPAREDVSAWVPRPAPAEAGGGGCGGQGGGPLCSPSPGAIGRPAHFGGSPSFWSPRAVFTPLTPTTKGGFENEVVSLSFQPSSGFSGSWNKTQAPRVALTAPGPGVRDSGSFDRPAFRIFFAPLSGSQGVEGRN